MLGRPVYLLAKCLSQRVRAVAALVGEAGGAENRVDDAVGLPARERETVLAAGEKRGLWIEEVAAPLFDITEFLENSTDHPVSQTGHALPDVLDGQPGQQYTGVFDLDPISKQRNPNRRTLLRIVGMHHPGQRAPRHARLTSARSPEKKYPMRDASSSSGCWRPFSPRHLGLAVAFGTVLAAAAFAAAGDAWPMFRGAPDLRGLAAGTLTPPLRLLWTATTGGPVKSSAAIAAGRVFVGSNDGKLHALALVDGKEIWATALGGPIESSPLVLGDLVCVGSSDGQLYAVAAASGEVRWKYATGDRILGAPIAARLPGGAGEIVVVGSYDAKVHAVDAATGAARWTFDTDNYVNGAPAVAGGRVVFGGCDGKIHALQLADGQPAREIDAGAYIAGSVAVHGDLAWAGHYGNEVICADLATGRIRWAYRGSPEPYFSSPAVDATRVIIGGRDHQLHCLNRQTGQRRWTFTAKDNIDSSPVICGAAVVFGSDDGRLYLVNLADGRLLWSYEIGKPIDASPAVASGLVVIGGSDGVVYAFRSAARPN